MFHDIPQAVLDRMEYLQELDARDRTDGTPRLQRLRQIPPEAGKLIALLAAGAPSGQYVEIGTSAGYSTLWLALACRAAGRRIRTFELLEEKIAIAHETFRLAGVGDVVELVAGDARRYLQRYEDISFCFLDAEKDHYDGCYELVIPNMIEGGLYVADNVISHKKILESWVDKILKDKRVDSLVVPVGSGLLVCRKV